MAQGADCKRTFACPACAKGVKAPTEMTGKKVRCPHCKAVVRVPQGDTEPKAGADLSRQLAAASTVPPNPQSLTDTRNQNEPPPGAPTVTYQGENRYQELCRFLAPPQAPDELGRLGPYRVLAVLGAGGMGVVFRAEDPQLQRLVALKAMLPGLAATEHGRQRFLREAQAAAALKHDHVVSVYQVGEDRGVPFLAMEYLDGEPLDRRLQRDGKLPLPDLLRMGREIALGLAAAHKRGVIHRDIKPANLWLEAETGRIKVLDFGLARAAREASPLTKSGVIVGTPEYMAPEQVQGKGVDARCDLFSLGCVLYRMATGRVPFAGTDMISTLMAVVSEEPRSPRELEPGVPADLSHLILRLLAKEPEKRPESAQAVAETLRELAEQGWAAKDGAETRAARPRTGGKKRLSAAWLLGLGGSLAALVLAALVILWSAAKRDKNPDKPPESAASQPTVAKGPAPATRAAPVAAKPPEPPPSQLTNSIGMKLLRVSPGTYAMGFLQTAEDNDNEPVATEQPQHLVTISRPFYLAVYKTTQEEFEKVLGRNPSYHSAGGEGKGRVAGLDTSRFPVEQATFFDILEFCIKLSERETLRPFYRLREIQRSGNGSITSAAIDTLGDGTGYRLPSEAEWEYCARAGTTMRYACTNDPAKVGEYAWYYNNSDYRTHPVGEKKPNAWGFHDMTGMLHEWCEDPWHPNYEGAPTDGRVWYEGGNLRSRAHRGGWFRYRVWSCRCAVRYPGDIQEPLMISFRVVRAYP